MNATKKTVERGQQLEQVVGTEVEQVVGTERNQTLIGVLLCMRRTLPGGKRYDNTPNVRAFDLHWIEITSAHSRKVHEINTQYANKRCIGISLSQIKREVYVASSFDFLEFLRLSVAV